MAQLLSFCLQICSGMCACLRLTGNALAHVHACSFECGDLLGIIGDQSDLIHTHASEYRCGQFELTMIGFETEFLVSFDGVESLVLKLVCLELGYESNTSTFLLFIQQNSRSSIGNHAQSELEL